MSPGRSRPRWRTSSASSSAGRRLALAEEPARFIAALESGPPGRPGPRDRLATSTALAAAIRAGKISPVEATRECSPAIERLDGRLRAFITVDAAGALAAARALEAEQRGGALAGPLHGVPLAYKDLCFIRGLPTSCGTRTAEYFTAEQDCTAVAPAASPRGRSRWASST